MIAILLLALSFPQNPQPGQTFKASGHTYDYLGGAWILEKPPAEVERILRKAYASMQASCPSGLHRHPPDMDTSQSDVKGGPLPKADGKCHADSKSDERMK